MITNCCFNAAVFELGYHDGQGNVWQQYVCPVETGGAVCFAHTAPISLSSMVRSDFNSKGQLVVSVVELPKACISIDIVADQWLEEDGPTHIHHL